MKISARQLIRLYPRAWRERYGEEFLALVNEHVDWRTAMNVMKAAVFEQLRPSLVADRRSVARALATSGLVYLSLLAVMAVLQLTLLFDRLEFDVAMSETLRSVSKLGRGASLVWIMLTFGAVLVGMIVSRAGWTGRRPRLARNLVRFSVFLVVIAFEVATAPPIARISPFSLQQIVAFDLITLLIGFTVARAMFGPKLRRAATRV